MIHNGTKEPTIDPDYYAANFERLLDFVYDQYPDVLNDEEIVFRSIYKSFSDDSRRLFVRLLSRKGPFIRKDKLNYAEVEELDYAINELAQFNFVYINLEEGIAFALGALSVEELRNLASQLNVPSYNRKLDLIDALLQEDEAELWNKIQSVTSSLVVGRYDIIYIYKLLFFGNDYQDLSEFLLEDVGVLKFEKYRIDKETRYFDSRQRLNDIVMLNNLRKETRLSIENRDIVWVKELLNMTITYDFPKALHRKTDKIYNEIGRYFERQSMFKDAQQTYGLSLSHPARERTARILDNAGYSSEALELCKEILSNPWTYDERLFAQQFSERLKKKLDLPWQPIKRLHIPRSCLELAQQTDVAIEIQVVEYLQRFDSSWAIFSENTLWKSLFGLLFWDEIFTSLPGVFFNPFQRGPADLYDVDFYEKRRNSINQKLALTESEWKKIIKSNYAEKKGYACSLVNWKYLDKIAFDTVVDGIPSEMFRVIFKRMLQGLGEFGSGLPDLLVKRGEGVLLMEVKGPGDQIRTNQRRWLKLLMESGIPVELAKITWQKG